MRTRPIALAVTLLFLAAAAALAAHPPHAGVHVDQADPAETAAAVVRPYAAAGEGKWWKGNLHTHTLWSDGNDFPEMVVDWYKRNGYHFLGLSDHNVLPQGSRWVSATRPAVAAALPAYLERFGPAWVERRDDERGGAVRLKPLSEYRTLFDEPGRFLMIPSEEITDRRSVHVNATNLLEFIPPQGGPTTQAVMSNNVNAVYAQRDRTGQAMFPHVNHPNFQWAITAEELAGVERLRFFEVYNGHPSVHNDGDVTRAGMDRAWDIILTTRLGETGLGVVYALAVDDAHHYAGATHAHAGPGRGWVMVRAAFLTPEHLIAAMEAGDFYASTGVVLDDIERAKDRLSLTIAAEPGVTYRTQFIGTRRGYDARSEPLVAEDGRERLVTRRYSDDVGEVLAEVEGASPSYAFRGDEIYVRAKVVSSKTKPRDRRSGREEFEAAWVQPMVLEANAATTRRAAP